MTPIIILTRALREQRPPTRWSNPQTIWCFTKNVHSIRAKAIDESHQVKEFFIKK